MQLIICGDNVGYRLTVYISIPDDQVKEFADNLNNALKSMGYRSISAFISDILLAVATAYGSNQEVSEEIRRVIDQRQNQAIRRTRLLSIIRGVIR